MTHSTSTLLRASAALLVALPMAARAQTTTPEVEPNDGAGTGTVVNCMVPGDKFTGTSTGMIQTGGTIDTVDWYRVNTCALPLGIYRHKLTLTSTILGQAAGLYGVDQTSPGCGTAAVQGPNAYFFPNLSNNEERWDAFGKAELSYLYVGGTPGTTAPYTMTLSTTTITPTIIGPFAGGSITITSVGQGHTTDTSLVVYDSTFTMVGTFLNEDECPAATFQSTLTRTYTAGTYYLAMGTWPLLTNQLAPADDAGPVSGQYATPSADEIVAPSFGSAAGNVSFAVTDAAGTTPVTAAKNFFYDTRWFQFTVSAAAPGVTFCVPGVSGVIACACGNPNGAGAGCANTGSSGGVLSSSGTASLASDATDPGTVSLTGTNMLSGSSCIFLQGDNTAGAGAGVTFGAGIRCTGGQLFRLKVKGITAGSATYPVAGDVSISNRSIALGTPIPAAATRWYQIYYRDPTLANPGGSCPANATFNITDGQQMVWN